MFKKYRQLVIGIVIGAFAFSVLPISAAVEQFVLTKAPYKIIVNGSEYIDVTQPALNLNGNTYVPLRNLGKLLGQEPNWNTEKKQVEIGENNIDLNIWIDLNTLFKQHNVKVEVGDNLTLENGDKKYSVPRPNATINDVQLQTDSSNNITFSCIVSKGKIYLKIDELKAAGIIN